MLISIETHITCDFPGGGGGGSGSAHVHTPLTKLSGTEHAFLRCAQGGVCEGDRRTFYVICMPPIER